MSPEYGLKNHEQEFQNWPTLKARTIESFGQPTARQVLPERKLVMRTQLLKEWYTCYIYDVLSLCKEANKDTPENYKIQHLLKDLSEEPFGGSASRKPILRFPNIM